MLKFIGILIVGILTSFYYFPIEFTFLPGVNTKMAMAGFGLIVLFFQLARQRRPHIDSGVFKLSLIALAVSFFGFASVAYNETYDYTYATYIVSMWVWLSGAYVVVTLMRALHGYMSIELVCNYLIGVCTLQCISALMIDSIPAFKAFIDTYVSGFGFVDTSQMIEGGRLYGIGAGLDVAGLRFSAVLCAIAYITSGIAVTIRKKYIWIYLVCFVIISLVGNMMARTTIVGVVLAIVYWGIGGLWDSSRSMANTTYLWKWVLGVCCVSLMIIIPLYNIDSDFRSNVRFAFEGFFSLAETGQWEVHSNNLLKEMYVFPDNLKTWIIGDGYIENPKSDPYYIGEMTGGYYMGTDVGYLRFIFYFGVLGLITFVYYFVALTKWCMSKFTNQQLLFLFFLLVNMIGWFKVSTDVFLVFAPFLLISSEENEEGERLLINDNTRSVHE